MTARRAQVVRIENLDELRLGWHIGKHNAAIVVLMLTAQQRIGLVNETQQCALVQRGFGHILPKLRHIPT